MGGPHDPMDLIDIRQGASGELTLKKKKNNSLNQEPFRVTTLCRDGDDDDAVAPWAELGSPA